MPISGGKYVAPTWVNSTSPPIDAGELQDICDSIEAYADPASTVPTIPNPNLLDNWYFVGGGSQQGGGQFPLNSKGQTSYNGAVYTIDRWRLWDSSGTFTIHNGYIESTKPFFQSIEIGLLDGMKSAAEQITVSFLTSDNVLGVAIAPYDVVNDKWGGAFDTGGYFDLSTGGTFGIYVDGVNITKFVAVKLELGPTQTLAHQESGTWVLNEIPNYDIQFARCSELPSVPARYETGTYVGTGTVGSSNPNTLTFGFKPKHVVVTGTYSSGGTVFAQFVSGMTAVVARSATTTFTYDVTWGDNSLSWYYDSTNTTYAWRQMNVSGVTYYYTAIG